MSKKVTFGALAVSMLVVLVVHFAWADPLYDFSGGTIQSGSLTIDLADCTITSGAVSGHLDFTDSAGIAGLGSTSLTLWFIDPSTGVITTRAASVTPALLANTATWSFSGESVPTGLDFIGVNLEGSYMKTGGGTANLGSTIAAWGSL